MKRIYRVMKRVYQITCPVCGVEIAVDDDQSFLVICPHCNNFWEVDQWEIYPKGGDER